MQLRLKIYRFDPGKNSKAGYDGFKVPYRNGMTVLDGLNFIQNKFDKSLAFRWECRSGICGTCGMMLDGKPVLGCTQQLVKKAGVQTIEPLANFPVERDLIVDLSLVLERLKRIRPYLQQKKDVVVTKRQADKSKPFRKCIECGCCVAGSKTVAKKGGYENLDPMALVKLARFVTDPRDSLDRKLIAKMEGVEAYKEVEAKTLTKLCPRGVPIDEAVRVLQSKGK